MNISDDLYRGLHFKCSLVTRYWESILWDLTSSMWNQTLFAVMGENTPFTFCETRFPGHEPMSRNVASSDHQWLR